MDCCRTVLGVCAARIVLTVLFVLLWMSGHEILAAALACLTVGYGAISRAMNTKSHKFASKDAVIITGCDSGLGYGLALHCQSLGAVVFAGVHNDHSSGAVKLKQCNINVTSLDVTIRRSVNDFCMTVARSIEKDGLNLRAIVNNVGVMVFGEFEWQTEEQMSEQIHVNLLGNMVVTQRLLPLVRSHRSRIIFVSSHCALQSLPGVAAYGATKAGLLGFATSLRVELGKYGIPVVSFIPGSFVTESNIMSRQKEHFQKMRENMNEEARDFYGEYFDRYEQYLLPISQKVEPAKLSNDDVFRIFENCLFDKCPRAIYKCEPWRYTMYHSLCRISPTCIRDHLIERFMSMPKWKEQQGVPRIREKRE